MNSCRQSLCETLKNVQKTTTGTIAKIFTNVKDQVVSFVSGLFLVNATLTTAVPAFG